MAAARTAWSLVGVLRTPFSGHRFAFLIRGARGVWPRRFDGLIIVKLITVIERLGPPGVRSGRFAAAKLLQFVLQIGPSVPLLSTNEVKRKKSVG